MNDIIKTDHGWTHKSEIKALKKLEHRLFWRTFMLTKKQYDLSYKRYKLNKDNRKWAYIIVGSTRKICWVDNKTMKAYKSDGYKPTWIEIKKFKFDRWCTSFDL